MWAAEGRMVGQRKSEGGAPGDGACMPCSWKRPGAWGAASEGWQWRCPTKEGKEGDQGGSTGTGKGSAFFLKKEAPPRWRFAAR